MITAFMFMLSLLFCSNNQQAEQTKERTATLTATEKLMVDSIIASELKVLKNRYEKDSENNRIHISHALFPSKSVLLNCEQCSDLDILLILERFLSPPRDILGKPRRYTYFHFARYDVFPDTIKGTSYFTQENEVIMRHKLQDVEVRYEKKFNIPTPWWWVCSLEERIRRLETAIKTGKRYPHYPVSEGIKYYEMGKTMAAYEMWFGRPLPDCIRTNCSEEERVRHAEQALDAGLPHLSRRESAALKKEMRTEYRKKFGVRIPNYWLSVARVQYSRPIYAARTNFFVTRTASYGAVAKDVHNRGWGPNISSLELDMGNWLDFINTLDNFGVNEWEKIPHKKREAGFGVLNFLTLDNNKRGMFKYCIGDINKREIISVHTDILPSNWREVIKVIDDMRKKVREEGTESWGGGSEM
ncbi:MAG: hypothetical protein LBU83_09850 [Bacteroidales bacterium]|nr:hypothetical protein [Bacteroidales bacterium]